MSTETPRSRFLREMLRHYETGNALAMMDLANEFSIESTTDETEGLSDNDNRILGEMNAKVVEIQGDALIASRVNVGKPPRTHESDLAYIVVDHVKRLSVEAQKAIIRKMLDGLKSSPECPASGADTGLNALESRYARELIDLLPNIVAKASSLKEMTITRIPKQSVQRYFREAHYCYFYGLNRACAVLCRAILETSLKEILGPRNTWSELIELAATQQSDGAPLLDRERIEAAERIYRAGNSAVHQEHIFDQSYRDDAVEELLLDMRKVLEDLYTGS
jgi:hypothetical protein